MTAAGALTVAAGAAATAVGMGHFPFASQVNAVDDDELVVDGIYRYTRNPQYLGWSGVLLGAALALRSPRALALAAVYPPVVGGGCAKRSNTSRRGSASATAATGASPPLAAATRGVVALRAEPPANEPHRVGRDARRGTVGQRPSYRSHPAGLVLAVAGRGVIARPRN